jgi:hypothetical protein
MWGLSWHFVIKVVCGTILAACSLVLVWTAGPTIESRLFPVVSKLRIVTIAGDADGNAIITAEFSKLRNCEYVGLSWFRGLPEGEFERVPVILLRKDGDTSSPNRPVGTQRAGPWIIGMPPGEVRGNSFAKLYHRCHGAWLTTTDFFP